MNIFDLRCCACDKLEEITRSILGRLMKKASFIHFVQRQFCYRLNIAAATVEHMKLLLSQGFSIKSYAYRYGNSRELYLQWTTMGPVMADLVFTLLLKSKIELTLLGTPLSGQAVKWNSSKSRL